MFDDEAAEIFVTVAHVEAISDGLALICQLPDGRRIGVPPFAIAPASQVRKPGDRGTLLLQRHVAQSVGVTR